MIRLENLKEDTLIAGLQPGEPVRVLRVRSLGDNARSIAYTDGDGRLHERTVFRDDESALQRVESGPAWSFSADAEKFKLAVEAQRIRLAHLFDPMMAVHTSAVEPLPHQISAVYEYMLPRQPLRYVLADDPGAGKTIMAGLYIRELILRADAERILIVAPGSLVEQWQDEMLEKFELTFDIFSPQLQEASPSGNVFEERDRLIVRLDQVARNDELLARLARTQWDLVVVDEAHKLSASYFGNKLKETKRFRLGRLLNRLARHYLLMTATPHNGKETDFQLFMSLLDEDRFHGKFREGVHRKDVSDLMRRMVKEELLKFDGTRLFPERRAYTVNYELSAPERALYEQVTDYVRNEMNRADQLDGQKRSSVGFALTILQRRLASSPEAIFQSLKRRRKRLEARVQEEQSGGSNDHVAEVLAEYRVNKALPDEIDDLDESLSAEEFEALTDELLDDATTARTVEELRAEIETLKSLERQAGKVVESRQDRKWEELRKLLLDEALMFGDKRARRKLIIFTEHKDTLNYLCQRISQTLGKPEAVVAIHGSVKRDHRRAIQEKFWTDREVTVLVATDAAGEGVNLQAANLMINYDLPWNPNRIEQRFGRIHRIGQQEVCHLWNLVATDTREGDVFQRLFEKLEVERGTLGGRVFDILGEAFEGQSLRDLMIEAIRYGEQPEVRRQLFETVDDILDHDHLQSVMQRSALVESHMSPEYLFAVKEQMEKARARKLHPHFIHTFFREAFNHLGGDLRPRETGRFEIRHVPARIRERDRRIGSPRNPVMKTYERICFEKAYIHLPGKRQASLLHPGHPLMQVVNDLVLEDCRPALRDGAILLNPADDGEEPRILVMLEHGIRETFGDPPRVISSRLQFVNLHPNGRNTNAGWAPHLDMTVLEQGDCERVADILEQDWVQRADDTRVLAFAAEKLLPEHLEDVRSRRIRQTDKTKAVVRDRLMREIEYWQERYIKLSEEQEAGRQPRMQPENARRRVEELHARLETRVHALDQQREVASTTPRIISAALVIPQGLLARRRDDTVELISAAARRRIERMAMDAVMEAERALGHEVKDVSAEKCGWDITAQPPKRDGVLPPSRHIEVKGRAAGQETITVSRNEILTALNQGEQFILAVVIVDGDRIDGPHYIRRPFSREPDWNESSRNLSLRELLARAGNPGNFS